MPKSRIIIDLIDNAVPLEKSLSRLMALAKDANNNLLFSWVQKELQGYNKESDTLPDYRKCNTVNLIYSGINGRLQVTKNPLPSSWLPEDVFTSISRVHMYDGIEHIIALKNSDQPSVFDCTDLAALVSSKTNGYVSCISIYGEVPKAFLSSIIEVVKEKALLALMEYEKQYGSLDYLFIDTSNDSKKVIESNNDEINRVVLNVQLPETKNKDPWYSKVAWNIVIPIITAVVSSVGTFFITKGIS